MAKIDVLDILRVKKQTPLEFNYDNLRIPPMHVFLTPEDVEALRRIATSLRLSSKIELKYKMIDDIMRNRGFKRFSAGTNRVVYSFLEDTRFVVKIAVDKVGMQDNPMEFENQILLKPYCAKMFYISPCGTVGFAERVLPIKNKGEFKEIASDVFDILVNKILGKFVVEDVGTKYFMNWGVRMFDAPVLLDYPFIYKLDGKKLFCNKVHPLTNEPCNGEIDYDAGFNHLICTRCGKTYLATDLRDNSEDNKIIIKGGIQQMKIILKKGDQIVSQPISADDVMVRPRKKKTFYKTNGLVVKISEDNSNHDIEEKVKPVITSNTVKTNNNTSEDTDFSFNTGSKFMGTDVAHDTCNSDDDKEVSSCNDPNHKEEGVDTPVEFADENEVDTVNEIISHIQEHPEKFENDDSDDEELDTPEEDGDSETDSDDEELDTSKEDGDSESGTSTFTDKNFEDVGKSTFINTDDSYDDDEEPLYQPIRRKPNPKRDRFNSDGEKPYKKSSPKRIPNNK